ncbi:MAG TPA: LysR substrate-binding domain-containing protein [Solirubrobacteraceae bacterium]
MRVLREVAARGTIAGAAAALDFTPSAVSQQIATLEREACVALLDRGPSSVVLTEAGRALVQHAEVVLAQLDKAEAELRAIAGLRGGQLRLGSFVSVTSVVSRALHTFRGRHPDVRLTLTECDAATSLKLLESGQLDVALVYIYDYVPLDAGPAIEIHNLFRDPVDIAVTASHPLAGRGSLAIDELSGERWITEHIGSVCHGLVAGACRDAGFQPELHLTGTDDYRVAQALITAGIGVAFVPRLAQEPDLGIAYLTPMDPLGRTIAVACRAGGRRSPAVATMIDTLIETACAFASS